MIDDERLETARQETRAIIKLLQDAKNHSSISRREDAVLQLAVGAKRNLDLFYLENSEGVIIKDAK